MSDKRDRDVRKLFSMANTVAMDMLNEDDLANLTPHEIFIGACKLASEQPEELPTSYHHSPIGQIDKKNVAFSIDHDEAVILVGDENFEQLLTSNNWDNYDNED